MLLPLLYNIANSQYKLVWNGCLVFFKYIKTA